MKSFNTKTIAKIAILSAVALILMMMDFPLPFFPPFYKIDFSEVAVLLGAFSMGPVAAVWIEALKVLLNVLFQGSATAYVGEVANFLIGISFAVPAGIIYKKHKDKKHAVQGLVVGTICMTVAGVILNYAVLLPAYSFFYHMPMDALIGMGSKCIPLIHDRLSFVLLATSPFNIIKGVVVSVLTVLLYKHVSPILHR